MAINLSTAQVLDKYGSDLESMRARVLELLNLQLKPEAIAPESPSFYQRFQSAMSSQRPFFLTSDEVREMGGEIEEGWMLRMNPDGSVQYVTPSGWEMDEVQNFTAPLDASEYLGEPPNPPVFNIGSSQTRTLEASSPGGPVRPFFSRQEMLDLIAANKEPEALVERIFGSLKPLEQQDIAVIQNWAAEKPEEFLAALLETGRTTEAEEVLRSIFPDITPEEIAEVFGGEGTTQSSYLDAEGNEYIRVKDYVVLKDWFDRLTPEERKELAVKGLEAFAAAHKEQKNFVSAMKEAVAQLPDEAQRLFNPMWRTDDQEVQGFDWGSWQATMSNTERAALNLMKLPDPTAYKEGGIPIVEGLKTVGATLEKYIDRPWKAFVANVVSAPRRDETTGELKASSLPEVNQALNDAFQQYGWTAVFSDEVNAIWDNLKEKQVGSWKGAMTAAEWLNPAYFIPVGGGFGIAAKATSKVPLIGKLLERTAAGVQAVEKGMAYPVTKPLELAAQGAQTLAVKAGERLGQAMIDRLVKENNHLIRLMEIPATDRLIADAFKDSWMKTALSVAAKVPPVKKGISAVLGPAWVTKMESLAVEDIVARSMVGRAEIIGMGSQGANAKVLELRSILSNPVKTFGFDKKAYSPTMVSRLLPEYQGLKEAGTLEHVFTHPEMYNWQGMDKALQYVTTVHEMNGLVSKMLEKEGLVPEHVSEDWWIHRVVLGKYNEKGKLEPVRRPGRGSTALGAMRSYEKERKVQTMIQGIAADIAYSPNPEHSISTYIQDALTRVADARFEKSVNEALALIGKEGKTPLQIVEARAPGLITRYQKVAKKLEAAAKAQNAIKAYVNRGDMPNAEMLAKIEEAFPHIGRKFKALAEAPIPQDQLLNWLEWTQQEVERLRGLLNAKEATMAEALAKLRAEIAQPVPPDMKLKAAFRVMDYEDRLAYREALESRMEDMGKMVWEQEAEIEAIKDFLAHDPVAAYRGHVGKAERSLMSLLRHGDWPETLTQKQARMLLMGGDIKPSVLTPEGRVRWEYVTDQMADHFHMTEDEMINHLKQIREYKQRLDDFKSVSRMAEDRADQIKRTLSILDTVDADAKALPRVEINPTVPPPEPGMPEAGMQTDIFGYAKPYVPKGKGKVTQESLEDWQKLVDLRKKEGLPPPDAAVKPKVEGIKGLEENTRVQRLVFTPEPMTAAQRTQALNDLLGEAKALVESSKNSYWKAKEKRSLALHKARAPALEQGYIREPMFGGKIYDQDFIDAVNKFFGHEQGSKWLNFTTDVAGIFRVFKAALDFSGMAIQGIPAWGLAHAYLLADPKTGAQMMGSWYKAFGYSVAGFFQPDVFYRYMAQNQKIALQRISFGGSSQSVDFFQALEAQTGLGGAAAKFMEKLPLKPFHRAELSFLAGSEIVRNEFWRIMSPKALAKGQEFELAKFLDNMTGVSTTVGINMTVRQLEQSFMWFAPRYTRACLTVLADVFRGGLTGAEARKALGGVIGAGATYYAATQFSISKLEGKSDADALQDVMEGFGVMTDPITGEVAWKPSARMMTLKVGNYYLGGGPFLGGFWYGLIRLTGNVLETTFEVGDRDRIDLVRILKNGGFNKLDNPFIYWWYSRSSSFLTFMNEAGTALAKSAMGGKLIPSKDFLGYPLESPGDYARYLATQFEPIWMEQAINPYLPMMAKDNEIPEGIARAAVPVAELFGARTFPESSWTKFYDKAAEYIKRLPVEELDDLQVEAWQRGKLGWGQLTHMQKTALFSRYSDLQEMYNQAQADSAVRNSDVWQQWDAQTEEERKVYQERIDQLTDQVQKGEIDTKTFVDKAGEAGQNYGYMIDRMVDNPQYSEIYDYFDSKNAEGPKYGFTDDLALAEYESTILYAEDLNKPNGDYDWDERDRRTDAFIAKWGQDAYDRIRQYMSDEKYLKGTNPVWIRKGEDTEKLGRAYWRLPYKSIYQMTDTDFANNEIPAEYVADWEAYRLLETEPEKDAFLEAHPELSKDWRAEYRAAHPEDDARLALWGYGGRLQTREAYDLVAKWGKELNIPLESMGLGLPPQSLADAYFEYEALRRDKGSSSAEAKMYRLNNPAWEEWGEKTWGWKPIDDNPKVLQLSVQYSKQDDEYEALEAEAAKQYLASNPEYARARRIRDAYENDFPEAQVENYADYYSLPTAGYDQEWFLIEHPDFYTAALEELGWKPKDFSKIPTRQVWSLYQQYDALPTAGKDRLQFRYNNPTLDKWLIEVKGLKPIGDRLD